jgi:hypothetical protein
MDWSIVWEILKDGVISHPGYTFTIVMNLGFIIYLTLPEWFWNLFRDEATIIQNRRDERKANKYSSK